MLNPTLPSPGEATASSLPPLVDIAFLIVWGLLLLHCLFRPLYPLFGAGWRTRLVWAASFLLFNPVQLLLYFALGLIPSLRRGDADDPRRAPTWLTACAAFLLLGTIVLFHGPTHRATGESFTLRRSDTGEIAIPETTSPWLSFHANQFSRSTERATDVTTNAPGNGAVPCRTVHVMNDGDDPLIDAAGRQVAIALAQGVSAIRELRYFPAGERPAIGDPVADLYVLIETDRLSRTRWPLSRSVEAEMRIRVAHRGVSTTWKSRPRIYPHIVDPRISATVNYRSSNLHFETAAAHEQMERNALAETLLESIQKSLTDVIDKFGVVPALPSVCSSPYEPTEGLECLDRFSPDVIISGPGTFRRNMTVLHFEGNGVVGATLHEATRLLTEAGWRVEQEDHPSLRRYAKGRKFLELFHDEARGANPGHFIVRYEVPLDPVELEEARKALLDDPAVSLRAKLMCVDLFPLDGLSEELLRVDATAGELLGLAELAEEQGARERSVQLLRRASLLGQLSIAAFDKERAERLAKTLGGAEILEAPADIDDLRALGFTELAETREIVLAWHEPAHFFIQRAEQVGLVTLRVHPDGSGGWRLVVREFDLVNGHGRAQGTSTFTGRGEKAIHGTGDEDGQLMIETRPAPEGGTVARIWWTPRSK